MGNSGETDKAFVGAEAGLGGGNGNVAVATNAKNNGKVTAIADAGSGRKSEKNFAVAANDAENGEANASAGGGRNSDENKATAINKGDSGGKTLVRVALQRGKNEYSAGLVNSGDACEQSDIPYNADNVYNPCGL